MKKIIVFIFIIAAFIFSCTKNIVSITKDDIAGTWLLKQYSGGFAGQTYTPTEKITLSFSSSGTYTSNKNDTITDKGSFQITKAPDESNYYSNTVINFFSLYNYSMRSTQGINLRKDSLFLTDGCCDLYNYIYVRLK